MIDVVQQINAVSRQVGNRVSEAGEARVVSISQSYATSQDDLWDACTDPERIARWFLPISGDLRLHGRFQFEGNAGGTIERCDPPNRLGATWEFAGDISRIEVRLSAQPDGTTLLELEHVANVNEHWAEYGPGAVGIGWEMGLMGLALHVSSGASPAGTPEVAAWQVSEEGKQFVALSSQGWCEADIASGADESGARAAAKRTEAAYTGTSDVG